MKTIEQFAELRADMENGAGRDEVLLRAELSVPQWIAMQRRWLRALSVEAVAGNRRLAERYRRAFEGRLRPAPLSTPAMVSTPATASTPASGPMVAPVAAPSAIPPGSVGPPAASDLPARKRTGSMTSFRALDVTPFAAGGASEPPPRAAAAVEAEAALLVGETSAVAALTDEELGLAPASAPLSPAPPPPSAGIDATAHATVIDPSAFEPLPFTGRRGEPEAPRPAGAETANEAADMMGATAFVAALPDEAPLPFRSAADDRSPASVSADLTLEQYASLVVEIHRDPAARERTLGRYRLDEEAYRRVGAQWARLFSEQPTTYGQFRARCDEYSAWLDRRR